MYGVASYMALAACNYIWPSATEKLGINLADIALLRARLLQVDSAALGEAVRCLGLPGDKSPALPLSSATGDSGAAESTIQDAGWNGGQPAWQLRILSICANALSLPSRPA
jgi:hypothetical protein